MWDKTMKKMDYFLLICSKVIFGCHLPVNPAIYEAACKLVTKWLQNCIVAIPYMFPIRFLSFFGISHVSPGVSPCFLFYVLWVKRRKKQGRAILLSE